MVSWLNVSRVFTVIGGGLRFGLPARVVSMFGWLRFPDRAGSCS